MDQAVALRWWSALIGQFDGFAPFELRLRARIRHGNDVSRSSDPEGRVIRKVE